MFPGTKGWSQAWHLHLLLCIIWVYAWLVFLLNHLPLRRTDGLSVSTAERCPQDSSISNVHRFGVELSGWQGRGEARIWLLCSLQCQQHAAPAWSQALAECWTPLVQTVCWVNICQHWWGEGTPSFCVLLSTSCLVAPCLFFSSLPILISQWHDPSCCRSMGIAGK